MVVKLKILDKVFEYGSIKLDPVPGMDDPEDVKEFYSNIYPELTQATIEGPDIRGGKEYYVFKKTAGTKGISVIDIADGKIPEPDLLDHNAMTSAAEVILNGCPNGTPVLLPSEIQEVMP